MGKGLKTIFYFGLCQIAVIGLTLFLMGNLTTTRILFFTALILAFSVIGDIILIYLMKEMETLNQEEAELNQANETAKANRQFYLYATLQQKNIREFYHDLNSHLMVLKIMEEKGQTEERNAYLKELQAQYQDRILQSHTGLLMMDILCQYLLLNDRLRINVLRTDRKDIDYSQLHSLFHALSKDYAEKTLTLDCSDQIRIICPYESDALLSLRKEYPDVILEVGGV